MFLHKMMKTPILFFTIFILINNHVVISQENPIPPDRSALGQWFNANVKPFNDVKASLDPKLAEAEAGSRVIKVRQDGSGEFKTINDALKSIPSGNTKRVILWLGGEVYKEKITIDRMKPFITFYASPNAMPNITFGGTAQEFGTVNSATLIVESDYFMAVNLIIVNSSPRPDGKRTGAQALAMRISGDKAAFYNCKMIGFQDTLCDDRGNHFFKDCFIEGTVDFIFGSGKSLYLNTELHALGDTGMTAIVAHARDSKSENTGYSFVHCKITGSGNGTYLGRAWRTSPSVVYAYTDMEPVVHPAGWSDNFHPERASTVQFGEYKCSGPGSTPNTRAKLVKQLSDEEVKPFLSLGYVEGSKWLLPPPSL